MHQTFTLVLLVGANVLSLVRAQVSSESAGSSDNPVTLIETAPTGATTHVLTSMITETPTATDSPKTVIVTETSTDSPASRTSAKPNPFPPGNEHEIAELKRALLVCYPLVGDTELDWSAPCPAVRMIESECTWGPGARKQLQDFYSKSSTPSNNVGYTPFQSDEWAQQPPEIQRACICSSQYTDLVLGCGACFDSHGIDPAIAATYLATTNTTAVQAFAKAYCDADEVPTDDVTSLAFELLAGQADDASESSSSASATASDRLGTATEVSLYFTPSVSSAYTVDMPTASSSANQTHTNAWYTYTSLSTSDGLIVPTAFDERRVTASPPDASQSSTDATEAGGSTATAAAGAMQTAMAHSGFGAGAFGLAALAFAL